MVFFLLFIIPLLVALGSFVFLKGITWKELLLQVFAQVVIAGISMAIIYTSNTLDHEVWNGYVVNKQQVRVSCSHSYECNCRMVENCSGTGSDRSCSYSRECDTCYEHSHDYDWEVYTSNNETIDIARIDRQGVDEPPRWSQVKMLEPTAVSHSYTNYIKAAPDSLFRHQGIKEKYQGKVPSYPDDIYDYYHINRLVTQGVSVNPTPWNVGLEKINSDLGSKKQVNIIVVLTNQPPEWFYALEETWVGGKKNDAILVVGLEGSKPKWARVMAWTTEKIFEVKLRDAVMDLPEVTPEATLKVLRDNVVQFYKRKPMKDFEYLKSSIQPSGWELGISLFIGLLVAFGLAWFFNENDTFNEEHHYGYRRYRSF